jgi:hypothetical protein
MKTSSNILAGAIAFAILSLTLLIWSYIVWNLYGYDASIDGRGGIGPAAIGGVLFGWVGLAPSVLVILVVLFIRRRKS